MVVKKKLKRSLVFFLYIRVIDRWIAIFIVEQIRVIVSWVWAFMWATLTELQSSFQHQSSRNLQADNYFSSKAILKKIVNRLGAKSK